MCSLKLIAKLHCTFSCRYEGGGEVPDRTHEVAFLVTMLSFSSLFLFAVSWACFMQLVNEEEDLGSIISHASGIDFETCSNAASSLVVLSWFPFSKLSLQSEASLVSLVMPSSTRKGLLCIFVVHMLQLPLILARREKKQLKSTMSD
jgi:hypothetical protein